ncbi:MAG: tol-pal system protein YbgF [Nitrospirae bacterium]|nr:tol-pal system protein YbgF [Nitrospirota bacterium]
MKRIVRYLSIAVLATPLLLAGACMSNSEYSQLKNEVNDLRRSQSQQKEEVHEIRKSLAMSESKTGGKKSDVIDAFRDSQEAITSKLAHLTREMQQLQGRYEERKYYVDRIIAENRTDKDVLKAQLEIMASDLKELQLRVARIDAALAQKGIALPQMTSRTPEASPKTPETSATGQPSSAPREAPQERLPAENAGVRPIYDEAYREFQGGKYKEARDKFSRIIKEYPTNPLAPNSYYWLSETYYKEGNYEDAILSYDALVKKYPDSDKVPAAKLKQALSFIEIKDFRTAKTILQQVIDSYPKTPEAEEARKRLQSLSRPDQHKKSEAPTKSGESSKKYSDSPKSSGVSKKAEVKKTDVKKAETNKTDADKSDAKKSETSKSRKKPSSVVENSQDD